MRASLTVSEGLRSPRLVYVTTVYQSLIFLRGHLAYLKNSGFDIHVISSPSPQLHEFGEREQITIHPLFIPRSPRPLRDLAAVFKLVRLLKQLKPTIVHSYTPKAGLLGAIASRIVGVPVNAVSVFGLPQMTRTGPMRFVLDRCTKLSCTLADWVWCDSASLGDYLAEHQLCDRRKLFTLGAGSVNGVDAHSVFNPSHYSRATREVKREQIGIPRDALVIGFVGRIARDKGIRELCAAWKELRCRYPQLHLLLVGPLEQADAPEESDWDCLQSDNRVHLVGPQGNVPEWLSLMDVFVNPSYREGFGAANLEASAMAIPVVSTRIPGCLDSVSDRVTGTLVAPRNSVELTNAIADYLDAPAQRERHGRAGRSRAQNCFQPATYWSALEESYRTLIQRKTPSLTL